MSRMLIEKPGVFAEVPMDDYYETFPEDATVISYKLHDKYLRRIITRVKFGNLNAQVRFFLHPQTGEISEVEELLFEN